MDEEDPSAIAEDHFLKLSFLRNTVEGVLITGNPNVWNVLGGLSRAKRAVFDIITNNLRHQIVSRSSGDPLKGLCDELAGKYVNADALLTYDDTETILQCWIEDQLRGHTLHACLKEVFLAGSTVNISSFYKEYALVKNEVLLSEFLNCLDSVQQNSMDSLTTLDPVLMTRTRFLEVIIPWIKERMELEEKYCIEVYGGNIEDGQDDICKYCGEIHISQSPTACKFASADQSNISVKNSEKRNTFRKSLSQDILMKSALSAVLETPEEQQSWYDDMELKQDTLDDLRNRLTRMQDLTRSESSLFQEHGHLKVDTKEVLSDQDTVRSQERDGTDGPNKPNQEADDANSLDYPMPLPRASSRVQRRMGHSRSKSDQIGMIKQKIRSEKNETNAEASVVSTSLPKEVINPDVNDGYYYQSGDGQLFPKPYEGQSLISYLDSRSYDTGAQLDKENAHFSICEALITAIEQMRCQKEDSDSDDSDPEIQLLKKKIIERRSICKSNKQQVSAFSDPSDTGRSSTSFKTSSTFSSSMSSSNTEEWRNTESVVPDNKHKTLTISASWENVSLAKTKSPDVKQKEFTTEKIEIIEEQEIPPDDLSAEAVAKSLLKKFQGRSLPAASELKWIVSEEEVPQTLLPLPTAWPVNPDAQYEENQYGVQAGLRKISVPNLLRGNYEWAPPRSQIIFSPHPYVKRKVQLQRQHFRCAGCGLKVNPSLSKRFRFCEYLGKYFCTSCHQNKLAVIPAKVLSKWDFKKYPVSDFAKELLKKIHKDPLFNIADVAPNLYNNVRALSLVKNLRHQLHYVKKFSDSCRHAESLQKDLQKFAIHVPSDPHAYSLYDLIQIKTGELQGPLKALVSNGIQHIKEECPLCSAKGFVCEFCRDGDDILYPFEFQKVTICTSCKTCYHRSCYMEGKCGRCERIRARKQLLQQSLPDETDDG